MHAPGGWYSERGARAALRAQRGVRGGPLGRLRGRLVEEPGRGAGISSSKNCARDRTKYGSSRRSTRSYYTHHTQRISLAAVISDARNIIDQVNKLKQDVCRSQ